MQYFGFTVTPVFGAVLASLGSKNRFIFPIVPLLITEYSLPALVMGCLAVINSLILCYKFEDLKKGFTPLSQNSDDNALPHNGSLEGGKLITVSADPAAPLFTDKSKSVTKMLLGGCALNMAMKGTIGVFETLGSEFVTRRFHWDSLQTGYTFAIFGVLGVICLLSFPLMQKHGVLDINLITGGSVLMALSCFILSLATLR